MEPSNILNKLVDIKEKLPKKQTQLCNYLLANHQDIQMMTIKTLAEKADVGTTTVLRLADALGFESYHHFRMEFHQLQHEYISKWDAIQEVFSTEEDAVAFTSIDVIWQEAIQNLRDTIHPDLALQFEATTNLLAQAKKTYIYGSRPYKATAVYMDALFSEFYPNIVQLSYDIDSVFDRLLQAQEQEVIVLFMFEPYTNSTLKIAQLAHEKDIAVILITDTLSSPGVPFATTVLQVTLSSKHYSAIPLFALIEALAVEVGKKTAHTAVSNLQKLVPVLRKMDIII